ncbi:MAG: hypothetical protein AABX78_01090 [Nanoarchaeota archaeon]
MVEHKFIAPQNFTLEDRIPSVKSKFAEILEVDENKVSLQTLRPPIVNSAVTYVMKADGVNISIWFDKDAHKIQRPGLKVYAGNSCTDELYQAIIKCVDPNGLLIHIR